MKRRLRLGFFFFALIMVVNGEKQAVDVVHAVKDRYMNERIKIGLIGYGRVLACKIIGSDARLWRGLHYSILSIAIC